MILISRVKSLGIRIFLVILPISLITYSADIVFSNFHLSALLTEVEKSEAIMNNAQAHLQINSVANTGKNCFRVGVVGRKYCGISEWNTLVRDVIGPASLKSKNDLQLQDFIIGDSEQFPFGVEFAKPKGAYRQHMKSWIDLLKRVGACETFSCYYLEMTRPDEISVTFHIAERTFSNVVPIVDFKGSSKRISRIFTK